MKMHRDLDGYPEGELQAELDGAESRAHVDFAFHLAVMTDAQIAAIPDYAEAFGLTSFKLFTAYKGEEGTRIGIQGVDDGQLLDAFVAIAAVGGLALVHCENQDLAARMLARVLADGRDGLRAFADSRPWIVEAEAIAPGRRACRCGRLPALRRPRHEQAGSRRARAPPRRRAARLHRDGAALPDGDRGLAGRKPRQGAAADP